MHRRLECAGKPGVWLPLLTLLVLPVRSTGAQAIGQGFELERAGRYDQAASVYFATLRAEPANLSALLGLERVLPPLNRLSELLPAARRATAASPANVTLRGILLRTYVALNEPDSARAVALRWATASPRDEPPYREWAIALENAHRHADARAVLLAGRQALGRPGAFGIELAELNRLTGDWEGAAREWAAALSDAPVQLTTAASELAEAPEPERERVARVLTAGDVVAGPTILTHRLGAELLLAWGQPARAWTIFAPTVASPSSDALYAVKRFADMAGARGTSEARRVQGLALARYGEMAPEPEASRAWAGAARAFVEAGDRAAARDVLERVARDSSAPPDVLQLAQSAVIEALIDGGQLDEAARQLASDRRLSADDKAGLSRRLARARLGAGDVSGAEAALGPDSSVEGLAVAGWIAFYRGGLKRAHELFQAAGPYAGDRRDATARSEMLALLQQVPLDSFPELGSALLMLAQGDSTRAVASLQLAAGRLVSGSGGAGRAALLLVAGRVAGRLGPVQQRTALALFDEIVRSGGQSAAAPAAELEWARLLLRQGQSGDAIQHLEHLILSYPGSAVVPEARRELERAKGAIPKS